MMRLSNSSILYFSWLYSCKFLGQLDWQPGPVSKLWPALNGLGEPGIELGVVGWQHPNVIKLCTAQGGWKIAVSPVLFCYA